MPAEPTPDPVRDWRAIIRECPRPLQVAAALVVVEGLVFVWLMLSELLNLHQEGAGGGAATAVFFLVYALALAAAAAGLLRRAGWPRGPVLITQLIGLGLAYNIRDAPVLALPLALVALAVVAALVHPASIEALGGGPDTPGPR